VVGEGRGPTASHSKGDPFLPIAELEFAIVRMTQDKLPACPCHVSCHAYFRAHPIGTRARMDREAGNRERNGGSFSVTKE